VRVDDPGLTYRPATAEELTGNAELFPEVGAAFEALGFRRSGGVVEDVTPATMDDLVSGFEPQAQAGFRRWTHVPSTALTSPDGATLALVGWFWDTPVVELASILTDGRPVLTRTPWQVDPPWPIAIQRYWKHTDRPTEQLFDDVPGRSIEIADTQDPAVLWEAHQAHLARAGEPAPVTVAVYCAMRNVAHRVNLRTAVRMNRLASLLVIAAGVLAFLVAAVAGVLLDNGWAGIGIGLACLVVLLPVASRLSWVVRHVRRWRVAYPSRQVS
jgi:hypothetical protein